MSFYSSLDVLYWYLLNENFFYQVLTVGMYVSPGNPDSSSVTEIGLHDVTDQLHRVAFESVYVDILFKLHLTMLLLLIP